MVYQHDDFSSDILFVQRFDAVTGEFAVRELLPTESNSRISGLGLADFNGDGSPELYLHDNFNNIAIYQNDNGQGNYQDYEVINDDFGDLRDYLDVIDLDADSIIGLQLSTKALSNIFSPSVVADKNTRYHTIYRMILDFENIDSNHLRECFTRTYQKFTTLHSHHFCLQQLSLKQYTMRAVPVLNFSFWHRATRHYRVQISNHLQLREYVKMEEVPEEVLVGWYAHELGHVMDYHGRSAINMLGFLIRYLLVPNYRMGAERRADLFAIDHGFGKELLATKRYILEQSKLPEKYKKRIRRYYLSPTELEELLQEKEADLLDVGE